jgi:hypothetical protein
VRDRLVRVAGYRELAVIDSSALTCRPCRGTGRLISMLGGDRHEVVCPWCHGTGVSIPGLNPQDSPAEADPPVPGEGGGPPPGESGD